jgi:hypothetical protein
MSSPSDLLGLQRPDGHFRARVRVGGSRREDGNATVTALTLRSLRGGGGAGDPGRRADPGGGGPRFGPRIRRAVARALDALEGCEVAEPPGAFAFWPRNGKPDWFPGVLPADLDDTALASMELLRAGRRTPRVLRGAMAHLAVATRVRDLPGPRPDWIVPGAFGTWIPEDGRPAPPGGILDLVVNANLLALLQALDLRRLPGFREAVELVVRGTRWAVENPGRATLVTPWYAHPWALREAVIHAARSGVADLEEPARTLARAPWARRPRGAAPVCRIAYGSLVWESAAPGLAARIRAGSDRSVRPDQGLDSPPRDGSGHPVHLESLALLE